MEERRWKLLSVILLLFVSVKALEKDNKERNNRLMTSLTSFFQLLASSLFNSILPGLQFPSFRFLLG